jgi:hypothetical protein
VIRKDVQVKSLLILSASLAALAASASAQDSTASVATESAATEQAAATPEPAPVPLPVVAPPTVVPAAAEPQCELHVWPAERFQAMTTGWLGGGLIDAAIHAEGDKARRSHLASALDSEGQLYSLQKLDLVSLLHLPPSKIVTHAEALDRKTVNKIKTRRSNSTAPCYSELIVTDVFYQKAAMWGRSLRTSFMFRQFPEGAGNPTIRKTTGGNGLKIFPAKEGEDTTAADAELVSVFQKNFTEAAANFAKQTR